MEGQFDFTGLATKNDILCADGRTIRKGAFDECDGMKVPLVWNHQHGDIRHVLGHALLKVVPEGVRAFCKFNNTVNGQDAKEMILNKDIESLSIWANSLKQDRMGNVSHGIIREVSLVLAGANPGARIDNIMAHGEDEDEQARIWCDQPLELYHSDEEAEEPEEPEQQEDSTVEKPEESDTPEPEVNGEDSVSNKTESNENSSEELQHSEEGGEKKEITEDEIQRIIHSMNDEQKTVLCAMVAQAIDEQIDEEEEGGKEMKHNAFEGTAQVQEPVLSHAAQAEIIGLAKSTSVGSLQDAIAIYAEQNQDTLAHGIDDIETLFPDYKDIRPGAPELITRDQTWVNGVIAGTHKSPITRIRTRQANAKVAELKAKGYKKGEKKKLMDNINLIQRTTDPQTVYVKDVLNRDDILDITDFDVVAYNWGVMKMALNETLAMAIMVGDQRDDTDPDKIKEDKIRPIWKDDELYTIHVDVDIEGQKKILQGTNTNLYFGDNYIYAEAIIEAALYAREQYKGSGNVAFYCTPHLVNVMLLARDRNGRRVYETVADLAAALNVSKIETAEQFAGLQRTTSDGNKKELLGLFVNLADYQVGCTKGGEITRFNQFDIDFNQEKMLMETRASGALTRIKSAIALELPVADEVAADEDGTI